MIEGVKPYPAMKDSGVEWLGRIPEHWGTCRAKRLFLKMERPVNSQDNVVTCFRDGIVTLRNNRRMRGFTESLKEFGYQGIRRGDLVIHAMDAFAGAVGVSDSNGKSTSVYSVCTPKHKDVNPYYYAFCVREMARSQWILALSKGIRERSTEFRYATFAAQVLPLIPIEEQTLIARFLKHIDRHIQRYIHTKQKLLQLLEEQKQANIYQAVTGQIDVRTGKPYPAYKQSGVEWLGEIPEHWAVLKLSWLFRYLKGTSAATLTREYIGSNQGDFPVYSGQTENEGLMGMIDSYEFDYAYPVILVTTVGAKAMSTRIVEGQFSLSQNCALAIPRSRSLETCYFEGVFRRMFDFEKRSISLVMQPSLRFEDLYRFRVPVPPYVEQVEIARYLNGTYESISSTVNHTEKQIRHFEEYRTGLFSDVVTGKIDVSEALKTTGI